MVHTSRQQIPEVATIPMRSTSALRERITEAQQAKRDRIILEHLPLVKAIGRHPAILDWEIFNEPEGMVQSIARGRTGSAVSTFGSPAAMAST